LQKLRQNQISYFTKSWYCTYHTSCGLVDDHKIILKISQLKVVVVVEMVLPEHFWMQWARRNSTETQQSGFQLSCILCWHI